MSTVSDNVIGIAGKPTELAMVCEARSKALQGGFLGNLFKTVSSVAGVFSPGIGEAIGVAGGLADAFDL